MVRLKKGADTRDKRRSEGDASELAPPVDVLEMRHRHGTNSDQLFHVLAREDVVGRLAVFFSFAIAHHVQGVTQGTPYLALCGPLLVTLLAVTVAVVLQVMIPRVPPPFPAGRPLQNPLKHPTSSFVARNKPGSRLCCNQVGELLAGIHHEGTRRGP